MSQRKAKSSWTRAHHADAFVKRARKEGFRSRAAYKLMEIDHQDQLLRPHMTVVELGAAPGGWSQYVQRTLGGAGRIIAVDILPMEPIAGVDTLCGDVHDDQVLADILSLLAGRRADLVISDMSPNISGISIVDQARVTDLLRAVLTCCRRILRAEGTLLAKLFEGEQSGAIRAESERLFRHCNIRKPKASHARSRETYLLARGFRAPTMSDTGA